ncbi:MAG: methionine--tRNA ligase [Bacteroidales bacterium]|nr:methionine--tRNA ligase [Bacteroidales bacterium]
MQKQFKRYLVTCALPYANGPIHIGHLAGVYIPADIYVRYLRLKKRDVKFICGSDEHGVPITIKALQEKKSPQEIVDYYHEINKKSFKDFGISFDIYSRTTSKIHYQTASEFFKKLYEKGILYEKETDQFYDPELKQFLADRYIIGTCPQCSYEMAYGDQCEKCGSSLNPTDLINPRSALTGAQLQLKKTKHWFLPLDKYQDVVKEWLFNNHKDWKINVFGQCKSWLEQGLQPRAVTRDLNWGIPVPLENAQGKVLYVWFDAPIGYISATKELTDKWELYWKDKETCLVHFIGKDNIVFHCIIFPVMLMAEGTYILPENVPANEFLNLEGDKISTSRNWAVWLNEYLEEFPNKQDVLRYVLTSIMPETKDNDFTWKDFQAKNNNELVAILGNFVHRTLTLLNRYFDGKIPLCPEYSNEELQIFNEIYNIKKEIENNIENFRFREALKEFMNIARLGNKYINDNEPWKTYATNPLKTQTTLAICAELCGIISVLGEPFLPFTSVKLKQILNIHNYEWDDVGKKPIFSSGHVVSKPELLFEKIDDSIIEKQISKLYKNKDAKYLPIKDSIDYETFEKLDIRTATIIDVEKVEGTDKLLKVTIDLGFERRTVVSGVAQSYKPNDLIGKQACVVVNLKPKKIRGIVSHGMILFADVNDKYVLISPLEQIQNGKPIK